jgi:hypothetical protein
MNNSVPALYSLCFSTIVLEFMPECVSVQLFYSFVGTLRLLYTLEPSWFKCWDDKRKGTWNVLLLNGIVTARRDMRANHTPTRRLSWTRLSLSPLLPLFLQLVIQ